VVESGLDEFCSAVIDFFERENVSYLVIGGLAVSVIGEPRMTQDIDLIVAIKKQDVPTFLEDALRNGFELDIEKELQRTELTGTFRLRRELYHADIIIASISLEESAFARSQKIKLLDRMVPFPSPEDLILLKIIVGRDKDILDAKSIIIRHRNKLDKIYLELWAQKLSDEAEDMKIWNRLMTLLK